MTDRLLARCLWTVIMSLIALSGVWGLILIYTGCYQLIVRNVERGTMAVGFGLLLAGGCWVLCRHSEDLMDRSR